jgi:hypothetical protein
MDRDRATMMQRETIITVDNFAEGLNTALNECLQRGWQWPFTVVAVGPRNTIYVRRYQGPGEVEKLLEQLSSETTIGHAMIVDWEGHVVPVRLTPMDDDDEEE